MCTKNDHDVQNSSYNNYDNNVTFQMEIIFSVFPVSEYSKNKNNFIINSKYFIFQNTYVVRNARIHFLFFVSDKALTQKSLVLVFVVVVTTTGRTKKSLLFRSRQLPFSMEHRFISFSFFLQPICMYSLFVWYFFICIKYTNRKNLKIKRINKTRQSYRYSRYIIFTDIITLIHRWMTNHLQPVANINTVWAVYCAGHHPFARSNAYVSGL